MCCKLILIGFAKTNEMDVWGDYLDNIYIFLPLHLNRRLYLKLGRIRKIIWIFFQIKKCQREIRNTFKNISKIWVITRNKQNEGCICLILILNITFKNLKIFSKILKLTFESYSISVSQRENRITGHMFSDENFVLLGELKRTHRGLGHKCRENP